MKDFFEEIKYLMKNSTMEDVFDHAFDFVEILYAVPGTMGIPITNIPFTLLRAGLLYDGLTHGKIRKGIYRRLKAIGDSYPRGGSVDEGIW